VTTKYIRRGADVTHADFVGDDGTTYLAGFAAGCTDDELAALDITKVVEAPPTQPAPTLADTKARRVAAINFDCQTRIMGAWPIEKQISALAGIYGAAELEAMTTFIDAHIAASNTASDAVDAATTIAAVEAVTVVWPA
jgi:hypothetical protein